MKNVIKGAVITLGILVALIVVNIICNSTGHELNSLYTGVITPIIAMAIYEKVSGNPEDKKA
ncbi:hypothetical protein [Butyrivibrio sp. MC2021]|uniref:hypothetical protein n=1 Tax=Butyrivibrio sp. MC2021 TaxID=1408306 RepID=UPI000479270E|nr:hypothetical protein [Butyrivibrio sp. MC2021]